MAKEKILVVDDEEAILELVKYNLTTNGYYVTCVSSGEDALKVIGSAKPDLIVLDIMLPEVNGLDVCKRLKADIATRDIPIIMLSARGEEADIVTGLELGADDYIPKPFSPRILIARVRAVLRKTLQKNKPPADIIAIHDLRMDLKRHVATISGTDLQLSATEFRILSFMARSPGWVFTRAQIVEAVHGDDYPVTDRSIDVQIAGLRKKLGAFSDYLETVWRVGYRFKE